MKRRFRCSVNDKKEYVAEVLTHGYRIDVVARRYGMSPKTLRNWVRQYQDEVDSLMAKMRRDNEQIKQDAESYKELQKKYEEALKLLGKKEVETQMLNELLKKKYPDWK